MDRTTCPFKDGKLCSMDCMFHIDIKDEKGWKLTCAIKESMLHGMGFWDKPKQKEGDSK